MVRGFVRVLLGVVCVFGLYGIGAVCCLFASVWIPDAMKSEAQGYAARIQPGVDSVEVHRIVGRPPDRTWSASDPLGKDAILEEWVFGGGKLLVRFDRGRVTFANTHLVRRLPALDGAVAFFYWWMPLVFGEGD